MTQDTSYGALIYFYSSLGIKKYLIVQNNQGYWGFPKGHSEVGEQPKDTVVREVNEETGIVIDKSQLGSHISYSYNQEIKGQPGIKDIFLFPVQIEQTEIKLQKAELKSYMWASLTEATKLINLSSAAKVLGEFDHLSSDIY